MVVAFSICFIFVISVFWMGSILGAAAKRTKAQRRCQMASQQKGGPSNRCTIPGANELGVCLLWSFHFSSGNKTTRLQRQSVCDALHSKAQKFINHSHLFNVHCSRNTEFCGTYYCLEHMKCCILQSQSKFISAVIKSQSIVTNITCQEVFAPITRCKGCDQGCSFSTCSQRT